jgi:hypothetical protein
VVDKAVNGRDSHCRIREDLVPFTEGLVAGDYEASPLVAFSDDFKQDGGFRLILTNVPEVIQDQAVEAIKLGQCRGQSKIPSGGLQSLNQICGAAELDPVTSFDQRGAKSRRQMGFPGAAETATYCPLPGPGCDDLLSFSSTAR